jgi:hypothetical protein
LLWLPGLKKKPGVPFSVAAPGVCVIVRPSTVNRIVHRWGSDSSSSAPWKQKRLCSAALTLMVAIVRLLAG